MHDPISVYCAYSAAWNEKDDVARRRSLLDQSWADDGILVGDDTPDGLVGRAALSDYIAESHEVIPRLVITETSVPEVLGNRLLVRWIALQAGVEVSSGTDFLEFAEDGHIARLTMFDDSTSGAP